MLDVFVVAQVGQGEGKKLEHVAVDHKFVDQNADPLEGATLAGIKDPVKAVYVQPAGPNREEADDERFRRVEGIIKQMIPGFEKAVVQLAAYAILRKSTAQQSEPAE